MLDLEENIKKEEQQAPVITPVIIPKKKYTKVLGLNKIQFWAVLALVQSITAMVAVVGLVYILFKR